MQIHSTNLAEGQQESVNFVNAFDEYNERNRKLFNIPEIDEYLSFEDKKNICIVNNSFSNVAANFLSSIISNACINHHLDGKKVYGSRYGIKGKKTTILIDAGNGNNLGHIYLDLLRKSTNDGFDIINILKQITIVRAFTFYQLLNIVINEIPKFILKLENNNCKIQIIILDFLDTLLTSFNKSITRDGSSHLRSKRDFKYNEKLLIEALDTLLDLSKNHFVILSYDNNNKIINDDSLISKFSNCLEIYMINCQDITWKRSKNQNETKDRSAELLIKIKSNKITSASTTFSPPPVSAYNTNNRVSSYMDRTFYPSSFNHQHLINSCVF